MSVFLFVSMVFHHNNRQRKLAIPSNNDHQYKIKLYPTNLSTLSMLNNTQWYTAALKAASSAPQLLASQQQQHQSVRNQRQQQQQQQVNYQQLNNHQLNLNQQQDGAIVHHNNSNNHSHSQQQLYPAEMRMEGDLIVEVSILLLFVEALAYNARGLLLFYCFFHCNSKKWIVFCLKRA